jgi:hypothetical protein
MAVETVVESQTVTGADMRVILDVPKVERNGPLSPVEIRRRLFPPTTNNHSSTHKSLFQPLQFNSDLSTLDEKYTTSGHFGHKGLLKADKRERSPKEIISLPKRPRHDPQAFPLLVDSVFGRDEPDSESSSTVRDLHGSIHSPSSNDLHMVVADSLAADSDSSVNNLVCPLLS